MSQARIQFYQQANQFFLFVLWFLFVFSLLLASWYDTWGSALAIGLPAVLIPSLLIATQGNQAFTRVAVGLSLMIFSALNIQQSHGMIEMHFGVFVCLAMLLYYRDWLPIVVAATSIIVQHLIIQFLTRQWPSRFWVLPILILVIAYRLC